ncbi:MAG: hypothetical protein NC483_04485 [Ruminococcus sp.]|nr:hypothetical protein [Ruminococcus sp.]
METEILEKLKANVKKDFYNSNKICISFVGGPGFGKTTISKVLCEKLKLFHCSNDYIARELEKNGYDISDYEIKTKLISSIAFPFQDFLFANDIDFVLDANLMLYLDVLKDRCNSYGYKLYIIELQINPQEALKRSLKRLEIKDPTNLSDSDEEDFKLFLNQYKEYKKIEKANYIFAKIDTEKNINEQLDDIIKKITVDINS